MMATATSPHSSLHLSSRESYGVPSQLTYYMETLQSNAAIVKRQRHSPPRLPAPPPPTGQPTEELGDPAAQQHSLVGPLRDEDDELATLKHMMISPHMLQHESHVPAPPVQQLDTYHDETPPSRSPSPLPTPEPPFGEGVELSSSPTVTRYESMENLTECDGVDQWAGSEAPALPLGRTVSEDVCSSRGGSKYACITREQLTRGGVYGGRAEEEGTMLTSLPVTVGHRPVARQHPLISAGQRNEVGVVSTSLPIHEERVSRIFTSLCVLTFTSFHRETSYFALIRSLK